MKKFIFKHRNWFLGVWSWFMILRLVFFLNLFALFICVLGVPLVIAYSITGAIVSLIVFVIGLIILNEKLIEISKEVNEN